MYRTNVLVTRANIMLSRTNVGIEHRGGRNKIIVWITCTVPINARARCVGAHKEEVPTPPFPPFTALFSLLLDFSSSWSIALNAMITSHSILMQSSCDPTTPTNAMVSNESFATVAFLIAFLKGCCGGGWGGSKGWFVGVVGVVGWC